MSEAQAQVWQGSDFSIERVESETSGAVILRCTGPFTARNMFSSLTPDALETLFDPRTGPGLEPASLLVLDLSGVPYMDSMGLGSIVTQYARLKKKGVHLVSAAATPRVMQLFELTHMDTVLPLAATVEEAIAAGASPISINL